MHSSGYDARLSEAGRGSVRDLLGWLLDHRLAMIGPVRAPHHRLWLQRSIRYLAENGYRGDAVFRPRLGDVQADWAALRQRHRYDPGLSTMVDVLDGVLAELPAILAGTSPVESLLPTRSRLDWIVDEPGAPTRPAPHDFVADYLRERAAADRGRLVSIVDLGEPGDADRDPASRLNRDHGGIIGEYRRDIQPGAGRRSDVVIAPQLLQRVPDAVRALSSIKAALKENGVLILEEIGGFDIVAHLTVGLTASWWRYDDPTLRVEGNPAVASATGLHLLESLGFRNAFILWEEQANRKRYLIVAESDGLPPPPVAVAGSVPTMSAGAGAGAGAGDRRLGEIMAAVRESMIAVLDLDPADLRDEANFDRYGVDSVSAGRIMNQIGSRFATALPATLMFDHSSVAELGHHLLARIPAEPPTATLPVRVSLPQSEPRGSIESAGTVQRLIIDRPGTIDDLRIVDGPVDALGAHDVRIAVRAFSLNFGDLLCVKGLYPTMPPYPFTPGMEVAGVVVDCGAEVTLTRRGEAVVAITGPTFGGHATVVTVEEQQLWRKPDQLSFEEACSLPIAGLTMIEVFRRAAVQPGERVLIQTAAGGAGSIGVQLAQHRGAEIFATAGTDAKIAHLSRLGVTRCIDYTKVDFAAEIDRLTAGRGVDVVINTLGGDALQRGLASLAPGGRYVEIAMTALKQARAVDLSILGENQSFHSLDLRRLLLADRARTANLFAELAAQVDQGVIRPVIGEVVAFADVADAYRLLEERRNIGKVVVSVPPNGVPVRLRAVPSAEPRPPERNAPAGPEPIAIIGMSGRYPRSENLDALWTHLAEGHDLTEPVSRWTLPADDAGTLLWRGAFLEGIDEFDAGFFQITDIEARYMDPQQRVFLEEAWHALEDAGYATAAEGRSCGVFVGAASVDYDAGFGDTAPPQAFWGNVGSVIPARIAYHLNLQGPAVAVDTACSSSLVATHMACQSLWLGEVEMALAGGVFLQPGPSFYQSSIAAGMISPSGRCRAFDDAADGFVPGEGVGVLVLKRLADAIASGDHIHGVIRGIGINQDGRTSGLTAPSGRAQTRLQRAVHRRFGIDPASLQLVEAHGTGTRLGDPIEFRALVDAFGDDSSRWASCAIGSVKTNLGHTVMAAGVTGILKILLALRHRQIPPSLHFSRANIEIDFERSPFFVNETLIPWSVGGGQARRAAVSSYGFSGTNAHAVIEEAPRLSSFRGSQRSRLIVLSGRTAQERRRQAEQLAAWCAEQEGVDLGDVSYTLLQGRRHFDYRLAVTATTIEELQASLTAWLSGGSPSTLRIGSVGADEGGNGADPASHFVRGDAIDLAGLFADGDYRRVPLPGYPFARRSYWVAAAPGEAPSQAVARADDLPLRMLTRAWRTAPIGPENPAGHSQRHWVFVDPSLAAYQPRLAALLPDADVDLLPEGSTAATRLTAALPHLLTRVGAAWRSKSRGRLFVQILAAAGDGPAWAHALGATFRSATAEDPKFQGQVIAVDTSEADPALWADRLRKNCRVSSEPNVRYERNGARSVAVLIDATPAPLPVPSPWRDKGVYLITGGAGALGLVFAREIANRCDGATIVLAGRSSAGPELEAALARLGSPKITVEYRSVDVTGQDAVEALVRSIVDTHGTLNGVIHAAGLVRDDFMVRKSSAAVREVLAPKALGIEYLDHATCDLPLDLFVAFSSVAAAFGNAGQGDYAAANAFLDEYAEFRSGLVASGARRGRTLSIAWPLWAEGGMGTDPLMRAELGIKPLTTRQGLDAFAQAVAGTFSTAVVMPDPQPAVASAGPEKVSAETSGDVIGRLIAIVREITHLPVSLIDPDAGHDGFGLDSLMIAQIHRRLVTNFPDLPKTFFFEHPTLRDIGTYLAAEYPDRCASWCTAAKPAPVDRVAGREAGPTCRPVDRQEHDRTDEIAIIGLTGTYPDAPDLDSFWANLAAGRASLRDVPPERWSLAAEHLDDPEMARAAGKSYCRSGGFIDGFADFDPLFFGISPAEALSMDPQERLFLQQCWHTVEDAGYTRQSLRDRHHGRVGVFAGVCKTGYELNGPILPTEHGHVHLRTSFSSVANRVSFVLDLQGPSLALDTMCSSSLTAIHYACESLRRDECELALAGGVNLYLHPSTFASLCAAGMLSPSGACRSFGIGADGFVPGEGVGVVMLKRLDRALADRDNIHAVIRASAVNHGGRTHGYTVPNPRAQGALIRAALDKAGVHSRELSYVEAHGTGTPLGDPVEIAGLVHAFAGERASSAACAVGSVKPNIGHLEAAAGVAGLSKIVLQMKHGQLAPSLHCATPNADIRLEDTPFRLQPELTEWAGLAGKAGDDGPTRLAGLSSFGAGGANGHLVIAAHRDRRCPAEGTPGAPVSIILSARSEERLQAIVDRLLAWLRSGSAANIDIRDIAYTLQVGREAMRHRLALRVSTIDQLVARLAAFRRDGCTADIIYADSAADPDGRAAISGEAHPSEFVDRLLTAGDEDRLAELWTRGLPIDWERSYRAVKPRRMSLPGYPFLAERYWPGLRAAAGDAADDGLRTLFPVWRKQLRSPASPLSRSGQIAGAILLEDDDTVDAGSVQHLLRPAPDETIAGFAARLAAWGPLDHLILWAPPAGGDWLDDQLLTELQTCIRPCFRIVKALLRQGYGSRALELTVVTRGGVAATPGELSHPAPAALHGLIGALAKEQPGWRIRLVDLASGERPPLANILSAPTDAGGNPVAIRQDTWFRPATIIGRPEAYATPSFRTGGVYVILGGAGYLGTLFSMQLVQDHQAQVVWIGRRAIDDAIRRTIDAIAAFGPAPVYVQADATDRHSIEEAYRRIVAQFGRVNGLVHAAIVLGDAAVASMSEERFMASLAAKSATSVRLAEVFSGMELDFLLFFSSLQSFGKLAGQSNYAAGCLFADAFAHRLRQHRRIPVKIVNWGSWEVVDGKRTSPVIAANMEKAGIGLLGGGDGSAAIAMLLNGPHNQIGFYREAKTAAPPSFQAPLPELDVPEAALEPAGMDAASARQVASVLASTLRQAVGLTTQPVSFDEPLASYGVDSITGVKFIQLVNAALHLHLDVKTIYDYPSLTTLAAHIASAQDPSLARAAAPSDAILSNARPTPVGGDGAAIAVIGISARFARTRDADQLWQHLVDGTDLVGAATIPRRGQAWPAGQTCGFLDDAEAFDSRFFGIGKSEARFMDPQHRVFLEEAWHALEDAGYAGRSIRGARCGVFVGHNGSDYHQLFDDDIPAQALWGNAASILSARIAYHLDLQGPAVTVDTACSSSLTAIHLACRALRQGEIEIAIAGGAQVYATPSFQTAAAKAGMLSAAGRCHSFDHRADGFVPAEGCGVLVLKRLEDAVAARDTIYGVVRASGTNQDGATNGITAPSGLSQERLQRTVFADAGIDPREIELVEAHGTGTKLGDPIEFNALAKVYGDNAGASGACALGSIKANIGHTLAAAGVAGAIKVLLALSNEKIPPAVHFERENARIDVATSPFFLPREAKSWPRKSDRPRLAAVSSFGFSGTNVHMVIAEAPPAASRMPLPRPWLVTLSAKGGSELRDAATRLRDHLSGHAPDLPDLSFTLAVGRHHFAHRLALIVESLTGLRQALTRWLEGDAIVDGAAASLLEKDLQAGREQGDIATAAVEACRAVRGDAEETRKRLVELAQLHLRGCPVDFERLFAGLDVGRVPLPGYCFRRDPCWVPSASPITLAIDMADPHLHDHRVGEQRTLPATAALAMVVAAFRDRREAAQDVDLDDIVWLRPIALGPNSAELSLDVRDGEGGQSSFEIRRAVGDDQLYVRGRALPRQLAAAAACLDEALARCDRILADEDVRGGLARSVAGSGPPSFLIKGIAVGESGIIVRFGDERETFIGDPNIVLRPPFIDAALQGWAAFADATGRRATMTPVPFALEALRLPQPGIPPKWAWVRRCGQTEPDMVRLDVDFFAADGSAIAVFRRLALRPLPGGETPGEADHATSATPADPAPVPGRAPTRALALVPRWVEVTDRQAASTTKATVVLAASDQAYEWAQRGLPDACIHRLRPNTEIENVVGVLNATTDVACVVCCLGGNEPGDAADAAAATLLLRIAKAAQRVSGVRTDLAFVVVTVAGAAVLPDERAAADQAAVHGVAGCLAKEKPGWQVKVVDLPCWRSATPVEVMLAPATADGEVAAWRNGSWRRRAFVAARLDDARDGAFREGGFYVLIGGAGALGQVLTEHLVRRYRARVVWIGRRSLDDGIATDMGRLASLGPPVGYIQADARDRAGLRRALDTLLRDAPRIDAIVHSALAMAGSDIAHMSDDRFDEVFDAKAKICRNLIEAGRPGSIGQIILFSSIQSFQHTERQANYAAGCAFKDAFAPLLAERLNCPVRVVNWGYWGGVGIAARLPAFQNWLDQAGIVSIEPEDGMAFLEAFLSTPLQQAAYLKLRDGAQLRGINVIEESTVLNDNGRASLIDALSAAAVPARTATVLAEMARYPVADLEAGLVRLLGAELGALGLFDHDRIDPGRWSQNAHILDFYRPWVEESLRALARQGLLVREGDGFRARGPMPCVDDAWREWHTRKQAWIDIHQLAPFLVLVERTLRNLSNILTGKVAATDVLFPGASLHLVEPIYKESAVAKYANEVMADALAAYLRYRVGQDSDAAIRILEIGAGTGGTTATLLPVVMPYSRSIAEYRYTDVSKAFLMHGETVFRPNASFLTTAIYDVERPLDAQGMALEQFDVVIAANVLHATRSIRRTLGHVRDCLAPGGLLLLNEMSANSVFSHLTFGLTKGWWLSDDPEIRIEGSPAIGQQDWATMLAQAGFGTVLFPTEQARHLGQQIVIAQKGATRDDRPEKASPVGSAAPDAGVEPAPSSQLYGREEVRRVVVAALGRALDLDSAQIDPDTSFADYGLDSIIAIATVDALNKLLAIKLTSTSLFEHSSVNLLVSAILRDIGDDREMSPKKALMPTRCSSVQRPAVHAWAAELEAGRSLPAADQSPQAKRCIDDPVSAAAPTPGSDLIAIIGISGRFGSADDLGELWLSLATGAERIEPVTRWNLAQSYGVAPGSSSHCWHGSFLNDIDHFDPGFFNISAPEAAFMDPQQRLFLEEAWKALEDAGYAGLTIEGQRCGVYVGQNGEDYRGFCTGDVPPQAMWGNAAAILSARISYYLNLKGPAITIDTACSSSLVAVHLACQALRLGEVEMAVAGGVAARCTPEFYKATAATKMVSITGHCRPFDAEADGFVPGEGVGAIVLKRLSRALADRDHVHAVIRSSCLNQDGTTNGITAPSAKAQEQLHLEAFDLAGVRPDDIQLVEAHGTGTRLGDPIEHEALTRAFRRFTPRTGFCALGSVKANVGHTTAAAGMASIAKVVLSLAHRRIPPVPNYSAPNPLLSIETSPFYVNTQLLEWAPPTDAPRRAMISSFGISGTNAHLIVEEAPPRQPTDHAAPAYLVVLSAQSALQLRALLGKLVKHCEEVPSLTCADISFTLLTGRKHLSHRLALLVADTAHLVEAGRRFLQVGQARDVYVSMDMPKRPAEASLLTAFGDQCIRDCADLRQGAEYLLKLRTVADLFVQGHQLALGALFPARSAQRVPLPTYPFARQRYWASDSSAPELESAPSPVDPDLAPDHDGMPSTYRRAIDVISTFFLQEVKVPADRLNADEDMQVYGTDSLIGMRLLSRLQMTFGVTITNSELLDLRTIAALAEAVAAREIGRSEEIDGRALPRHTDPKQRAEEALARYERGELGLEATEALLAEIALA